MKLPLDILNATSSWSERSQSEPLLTDEVHVWRSFLTLDKQKSEYLMEILSSEELERAEKMHFEKDRRCYVLSHGVLRHLLGFYLGKDPRQLQFEFLKNGKPILRKEADGPDIRFNMSHSGELALYAFALNRNVGVDVEFLRDHVDINQIAERFFSRPEMDSLMECAEAGRKKLFFQYWTRKEAFVKALGEGISFPLDKFDVSLIDGHDLSPFVVDEDIRGTDQWCGNDISPGNGYAGALAVQGNGWQVSYWDYSM